MVDLASLRELILSKYVVRRVLKSQQLLEGGHSAKTEGIRCIFDYL